MVTVLVSPAEPAALRALGQVSIVPEQMGCDFLIPSAGRGLVGVQRKEIKDLVASLADGRLGREIEMGATGKLYAAVLLIEGRLRWSSDGQLMSGSDYTVFTRQAFRGLTLSVQDRGWWVIQTDDLSDTIDALGRLAAWCAKKEHRSLDQRPTRRGWGTPVSYLRSMLQQMPGVGPDRAKKIEAHFGKVPIQLGVTAEELAGVPGIGKKTAEKIVEVFGG